MFVDMTKPHPVDTGDDTEESKVTNQQDTSFSLDDHAAAAAPEAVDGNPAIDSKPQIRIRNPPGGKSSIFF